MRVRYEHMSRRHSIFDLWFTGVLSIGLVMLTVLFHYEALQLFTRFLEIPGRLPRIRILYLVFGLFVLHSLEMQRYWRVVPQRRGRHQLSDNRQTD